LMSVEEVLTTAGSVALDGVPARIPSRASALLLACWHRVAHHQDSDDLLWLYDLHLLAGGLSTADAAAVGEIAGRTGTRAICARGLSLAAERFGTHVPASLAGDAAAYVDPSSLTAVFLRHDARKVDLLAADLRALPTWRARLRLVREHLFPPAEYMLASSGTSTRAMLPALYARRIMRGARTWLRRRG
jgi:hypothetical protein